MGKRELVGMSGLFSVVVGKMDKMDEVKEFLSGTIELEKMFVLEEIELSEINRLEKIEKNEVDAVEGLDKVIELVGREELISRGELAKREELVYVGDFRLELIAKRELVEIVATLAIWSGDELVRRGELVKIRSRELVGIRSSWRSRELVGIISS